jgi:CheY-like chemotaxis protein
MTPASERSSDVPSRDCGVFPRVAHGGRLIAAGETPMYGGIVSSSVLVVDDDALFRDVISGLLLARGFEVAGHAADDAQAIEAVQQLHPAAVLLDVNLGSSDGFTLSARLLVLDEDIAVLLTSSDPDAATEELAQQCGAVGFVPKTRLARTNLRYYLCPH